MGPVVTGSGAGGARGLERGCKGTTGKLSRLEEVGLELPKGRWIPDPASGGSELAFGSLLGGRKPGSHSDAGHTAAFRVPSFGGQEVPCV